ncbi:hypothetical protein G9G53_22640 [Paenibacillus sp. EKM206P]|uniref:hypothetical protein n=1 Tax=Paenibacillus sp. EKM206P TaxID=1683674 RepID=UPI0013EBDB05|nr:hypothetical protein [Paenibacillus sp. EKM206P]KAF6569089.1 hypothetical protein G9G53_22640 [Paenibacillus sp. EKM206P]
MKPTVVRNVHYKDEEGKTLAAIVVHVNPDTEGMVNLSVWNEFGAPFRVLNVRQGDGPGQWNWPPRV